MVLREYGVLEAVKTEVLGELTLSTTNPRQMNPNIHTEKPSSNYLNREMA
jgi:hypothetical protein